MTGSFKSLSLMLLLTLALTGCSSNAKTEARIRRAYAAGEQAARAQMEQQQKQQQQQQLQPPQAMQPMGAPVDSMVRILGHVKNPMLTWSDGLTLGRALVEAQYEDSTTRSA